MASATVSPKPSASDFCTTTSARRWMRVDHRRVLLGVVHRQRDAGAPSDARSVGQRAPRRRDLVAGPPCPPGRRTPRPPTGRRAARWASQHGAACSAKPRQDADGILQPVPARHLRDDAVAVAQRRLLDDRRAPVHPRRGPVLADEARPRPGRRRHRVRRRAGCRPPPRARASWFLAEKTSIDGGMIRTSRRVQPVPGEPLPREHLERRSPST